MFNCYKKGYCQNNYNPDAIETACSNVGTTAEYAQMNSMNMGCGCGCNNDNNNCGCALMKKKVYFHLIQC